MTTEPMRFHFDYRSPGMYPAENGKYVTYTDFAALKAERDALREKLDAALAYARFVPAEGGKDRHAAYLRLANLLYPEPITTPGPTP